MMTRDIEEPYKSIRLRDPNKQIRVLDVAAPERPTDENEPLYGLLRVVSFEPSIPKFAALSYVWGDPHSTPRSLHCRDHEIKLTKNCFNAVFHLRRRLGAFSIWIDAICINQNDGVEKSIQMSLMKDVYRAAHTVYIWLGAGNEQIDRIMTLIPSSGFGKAFFDRETYNHPYQLRLWLWKVYFKLFLMRCKSGKDKGSGLSLKVWERGQADVLQVEWLHRIWTYQEILFASNPVIAFGNQHIDWDTWTFFTMYLSWLGGDKGGTAKYIQPWRRLILSRVIFRSSLRDDCPPLVRTDNLDLIRQYQTFLVKLASFCASMNEFWSVVEPALIAVIILGISAAFALAFQSSALFLLLMLLLCAILYKVVSMLARSNRYSGPKTISIYTREIEFNMADGLTEALRARVAFDGRDYNLGIRGILQALSDDNLTPLDQNVSLAEADTDLASRLMRISTSAYPLMRAAFINGGVNQPSWATSWSQGKLSTWDRFLWGCDMYQHLRSATPDSSPSWYISKWMSRSLMARAIEVGQVTEVYISLGTLSHTMPDDLVRIRALRKLIRSTGARNTVRKRATNDIKRAFWKDVAKNLKMMPIIADETEEFWKDLQWSTETWEESIWPPLAGSQADNMVLDGFKRERQRFKIYIKPSPKPPPGSPKPPPGIPKPPNKDTTIVRYSVPAPYQKFCYLCDRFRDAGIFVIKLKDRPGEERAGIALSSVEVGDRVFLLPGVPLPMIMRNADPGAAMASESPDLLDDGGISPSARTVSETMPSEEEAAADTMRLVSPSGIMGMMQGQGWSHGDGSTLPYIRIV